jgi:hypothetical protein
MEIKAFPSSDILSPYIKYYWIYKSDKESLTEGLYPSGYMELAINISNGNLTTGLFGDGKEFVTEMGLWQLFDANNLMFDNGKYLVLWKKTPSGWKMFRDSFSSNNPLK